MEVRSFEDLLQATIIVKMFSQVMSVQVYLIDGLLIDTGPSIKKNELINLYNKWEINNVILTHHHDDHTGMASWLQKEKQLPIYIHEKGTDISRKDAKLPFYRRQFWGTRHSFDPTALEEYFETESYTWDVIYTPGHADDHISLYNREKGWMFGGDLYVTPNPKSIFRFESIPQIIESLKIILMYQFDVYFCAHAGIISEGRRKIKRKLSYLENIQEEVLYLHQRGYSRRQIRKKMFPESHPMHYFSFFENSPQHLVDSILG